VEAILLEHADDEFKFANATMERVRGLRITYELEVVLDVIRWNERSELECLSC